MLEIVTSWLHTMAVLISLYNYKGKMMKISNKKMKFILCSIMVFINISCQQSPKIFLEKYNKIDLLITNGKLLDGLGNPAVLSDLVVVGDKIVFVGQSKFTKQELETRVKTHIDAKQSYISPGFIDLHSHGDPLTTPHFENFLAMGVTTITLGQDGDSPKIEKLSDWLKAVEDKGIAINLAMFVGHGTLRELSGIGQAVTPTKEALNNLLQRLDDTLKYTFGLSTGLEYNPGLYAQEQELIAIAKVVGKNNRLIMSHMRNEDSDQLESSIKELLVQGKYSKIHISHIKSVYGQGEKEAEDILQVLQDGRDAGIDITADIYPYNASYAGISLLFPVWAKTNQQFEQALKTRREELEVFLRNKIIKRNGPEATLLGTPPYTGKTLSDLSNDFNLPFEQVLIKLGPKGASGAYFIMDDELQSRLLIDPAISISSDGSPTGFHPRGHGTFAKIIETYVNQRKVLSLPEAIRKMTSQSAKILGISNRGVLEVGKNADIIIFDPDKIKATASYSNPLLLAEGFTTVIVNGKVARSEGKMADSSHGRVLKPD